ncbi:class I SAM-dependent methyltransferase [Algihabitans albus]|uniref:class I SAM-dependent methyltransferase n=1 Tax=Algihabitans albus TaxID=2164067 RepID=UPI0013C36784|nr:class I SAM-dependent methyltransferase [Algihabitans albus]
MLTKILDSPIAALPAFTGSEAAPAISSRELAAAFEPFVERYLNADDQAWRGEIERRQKKIRKGYFKRSLLGWLPSRQRREEVVVQEYDRAWSKIDVSTYEVGGALPRVAPWDWRGQPMFASDMGATRVRQVMLVRVLEQLRPRRVLEVGCGNGINLMLLSCRFPDIAFTGVELTRAGQAAAQDFQQQAEMPEALQTYAPLPLTDTTAFRRIDFRQGNAAELPFEAGAFDLVYSCLALEQMERIRHQALAEVARVSSRHAFLIEPFRDMNDSGWPRRNVIRRDYFRGRIDELKDHGLLPVWATNDFPQEAFLKVCAVLAEKRA